MTRFQALVLTAVFCLLPGPGAVQAAPEQLEADRQALLLLKTLSQDKNLKSRVGERVVVVLVSPTENPGGSCGAVLSALHARAKEMTVGGLKVQIIHAPFQTAESFGAGLEKLGAAAIYVCAGLEAHLSAIRAETRRLSVLSVSGVESQVRSGLSVGFVLREGKAVLLLNLPALREEKVFLDPTLLRVAEVIE